MTTKHTESWDILSDMIRASAKVESTYISWAENDVFHINFRHPRYARAFQDAFESFVHASKKTVRNVQRKKSLKKNHK